MILDKNKKYLQTIEKNYFGLNVRAFTIYESVNHYYSFPWSFEIEFNGKLIQFAGIPNKVETHRKALKRAWYRAKWLSNEWNNHYK